MTDIPEKAVEQVAMALHYVADQRSPPRFRVKWADCVPAYRALLIEDSRTALAAALAHLPQGDGWRLIGYVPEGTKALANQLKEFHVYSVQVSTLKEGRFTVPVFAAITDQEAR